MMISAILIATALLTTPRQGSELHLAQMKTRATRLHSNTGAGGALAASSLPLLLDPTGAEMSPAEVDERLKNRRVALYFGGGWCPSCRSFEPSLLQFREAAAAADKPLELIYVSSDRTAADHAKRAAAMGMMSVPFGSEGVAGDTKRTYKVWAGAESIDFGFRGRRSGVPALVVLDKEGKELAFLPAEAQGVKALSLWPLDDERGVWDTL